MARTVFFSWQKDTPNNIGRNFLKDILHDVCKEIASDDTLDKSLRDLNVDSDTQGAAGQVAITETILEKIDQCTVFVADMTLVGRLKDDEGVPNPNVLIEYGRAVKAVGNKRVICVMNTAYGEPDGPRHSIQSASFKMADFVISLRKGPVREVKKAGETKSGARAQHGGSRDVLRPCRPPAIDAPPPIFPEARRLMMAPATVPKVRARLAGL